jgi:hypothetical protein
MADGRKQMGRMGDPAKADNHGKTKNRLFPCHFEERSDEKS